MKNFFSLTAMIGMLGIGWTGLPIAFNYFCIGLVIVSASYFGFLGKFERKEISFKPLIFSILASTVTDIFLIQQRLRDSTSIRLSYVQEVIPVYNGNLFTTDPNLFIMNDIIGMIKWLSALVFLPLLFSKKSLNQGLNRELLLNVWIVAVLINVFVAILNSRGVTFAFLTKDLSEESGAFRFSGLSSHPNHLATVINLTLPLAIYSVNRVKFKFLTYLVIAYLFTGQILTGSRIGLASFIVIVILSGKYVLNVNLKRLSIMLALFITFAVYLLPMLDFGLDIFNSRLLSSNAGVLQSNTARLALAKQGIADFLSNPIVGIGPRAFKSSHNIFLQLLASLGIIGFITFSQIVLKILLSRTPRGSRINSLKLSIIAILLTGLFSNGLADFFIYVPFGAIIGVITESKYQKQESQN